MDRTFDRGFLGLDEKERARRRKINKIVSIIAIGFALGVGWAIWMGLAPKRVISTVVEKNLNASGIALVMMAEEPKESEIKKEVDVVYEAPIRKMEISNPVTDPLTITTLEWVKIKKLTVTTTAYPPDEDDYRTSDNRLIRPSDYTIACSRPDLSWIREKIHDPRGSGRSVYRYRVHVPGYTPPLIEGKAINGTLLAIPRDNMPKTVWIDAKGARNFSEYNTWIGQNLFIDAKVKWGSRHVRVAARNWIDVLYTHQGRYLSIRDRCNREWGAKYPNHLVTIGVYELQKVVRRIHMKAGDVTELP